MENKSSNDVGLDRPCKDSTDTESIAYSSIFQDLAVNITFVMTYLPWIEARFLYKIFLQRFTGNAYSFWIYHCTYFHFKTYLSESMSVPDPVHS